MQLLCSFSPKLNTNNPNIKSKYQSTPNQKNERLNEFNKLQKEKNAVNKKFEKYKKSGEIKKKFLENQTREVYKKLNAKEKTIKNLQIFQYEKISDV